MTTTLPTTSAQLTPPLAVIGGAATTIYTPVNDQPAQHVQNLFGRAVSTVKEGTLAAASAVATAVQKTFSCAGLLFADSSAAANVFRKLDHHVLKFFEYMAHAPKSLSHFNGTVGHFVAFCDFAQLASDIKYLALGLFKEKIDENGVVEKPRDNNFVIGGRLAFFAANTGGALMWLQEMSFFSLSKAAATIGEVRIFGALPTIVASIPYARDLLVLEEFANTLGQLRVFGFVKNMSCLFVTLRALDLGYALFAFDASSRLAHASNGTQTTAAAIDLSSYLSELVLSATVLAGVTNVVALGVGASACIGLAAASFLYRTTHENELKQKIQLPVQAVTVAV